jgi:tight adherence protein C
VLILAALAIAVAVMVIAAVPVLRIHEQVDVRSTLRAATDQLENVDARRAADPSVTRRVAFSVLAGVSAFALRHTPKSYVEGVRRRLALAGRPQPAEFQRFLAVRVLTIVSVPVAFVLVALVPLGRRSSVVLVLFAAVMLLLGPEALLNRQIDQRKEAIRRQLADLIDLLNIGVQAGLSFEQALSRTAAAVPGALTEEFTRMLRETRIGADRREAFDGVIARTDVPELRSFLVALSQAEEFGISIVQILHAQSIEMRTERRQRAQEKAQKAPVKMLFPLVFCILPALFIVVVGPAAIEIYRTVIK